MDESSFRYVAFDPDRIWQEMHETYLRCGGSVLYPGDEKEILLRAVLAATVSILAKVDTALRMDTLTYATGEYLKLYGEKRNCVYRDAVAASAPITITFQATGVSQTIPAGTELTADGSVVYLLTEDVQQTGAAQTVNTAITCAQAGAMGNGLGSGAYLQLIRPNAAVVSIVTTAAASGGLDAEDEEVYRERIRRYGLSSVTTGPSAKYEADAMEASTDVLDAKAINDGGGEVGIYITIKGDAAQQDVITAVASALSPQEKRPLTDHVTVYAAEAVAYTLNVKVWQSEFSSLTQPIEETIADYQAWQDQAVGRAFDPNKLITMLYQSGVERAAFLSGSGMEVEGELILDYTPIDPREHCAGTITYEVVTE